MQPKKRVYAYTQVSEVVTDNRDSENRIFMLANQKAKKHEKLDPTRIYLDNFSMYNHMYNEEIIDDAREENI